MLTYLLYIIFGIILYLLWNKNDNFSIGIPPFYLQDSGAGTGLGNPLRPIGPFLSEEAANTYIEDYDLEDDYDVVDNQDGNLNIENAIVPIEVDEDENVIEAAQQAEDARQARIQRLCEPEPETNHSCASNITDSICRISAAGLSLLGPTCKRFHTEIKSMSETQRILFFNEYIRISDLFASYQYNTNTLKRNQMLALLYAIQMRSQRFQHPELPYQLIETISNIIQGCDYIKFYYINILINILNKLSGIRVIGLPLSDSTRTYYLPNDVLFIILLIIDLQRRFRQLQYPNNVNKWNINTNSIAEEIAYSIDSILRQSLDKFMFAPVRQININSYNTKTYIKLRLFILNIFDLISRYPNINNTFRRIAQDNGVLLGPLGQVGRLELNDINDETLYKIFRDLLNSLEIPNAEIIKYNILEFGISRSLLSGGYDNIPWSLSEALTVLLNNKNSRYWDTINEYYVLIKFPKSGLEFFLDIGFPNRTYAGKDPKVYSDHAMGSNIGFRKQGAFNSDKILFGFEYTRLVQGIYYNILPTPNWADNIKYNYSSYKGRRWAAHSGADSDDFLIFIGYKDEKKSFIYGLNYERHGVTYHFPPEVKLESRINVSYKRGNRIFQLVYENEYFEHYGFVDGNSNVWDEIFEQGSIQRTHTLLISLIHIFSL